MKIAIISKGMRKVLRGVKHIEDIRLVKEGEYKGIIYHSSEGGDLEILSSIIRLSRKTKLIYVNKELDILLESVCKGLGIDIYDTEGILTGVEEIEYVFKNYGETGMTVETSEGSVEVIRRGVESMIERGEEEVVKILRNELWRKTIERSMNVLEKESEKLTKMRLKMVDTLGELLKELEDERSIREKDKKEIEKLKSSVANLETNTRPNMPFLFSSYTVPILVNKVLYIKEYGDCKYLLSFLSAYQHYIKMHKQYRSKMLIMLPKLSLNIKKYSEKKITQLTMDSLGIINLKNVDICVTYEPKKSVLDAFFKESADLYIVVDKLGGGKMLEEGFNVVRYDAIGGLSDIKIYGLEKSRIISSLTGVQGGVMIPYILKYQEANEQSKRTYYYEKCKEGYKALDNALKI